MDGLPHALLQELTEGDCQQVRQWWATLAEQAREDVRQLWEPQLDDCFLGIVPEGEPLPRIIGGLDGVHDDAWNLDDWIDDWREHLIAHSNYALGNHGHGNTVFVISQLSTIHLIGMGCRYADWSLTRFTGDELPPSERPSVRSTQHR